MFTQLKVAQIHRLGVGEGCRSLFSTPEIERLDTLQEANTIPSRKVLLKMILLMFLFQWRDMSVFFGGYPKIGHL